MTADQKLAGIPAASQVPLFLGGRHLPRPQVMARLEQHGGFYDRPLTLLIETEVAIVERTGGTLRGDLYAVVEEHTHFGDGVEIPRRYLCVFALRPGRPVRGVSQHQVPFDRANSPSPSTPVFEQHVIVPGAKRWT